MIYGVDVSNWQGTFDWSAHKVSFGFVKATEGTTFVDGQFARNWSQMKSHKLVRGAYHFGHPKNDPIIEAEHFLSVVRPRGLHDGDLLALDLEVADGRSPASVAAYARKWCSHVQQRTGIRPVVYTFISFARNGSCKGLGGYPLWIAAPSYPKGKPPMPLGPWKTWAVHQYSDSPYDKDISHLTVAQLRALGGDDMSAQDVWSYPLPKTKDFPSEWQAGTHLRHLTVEMNRTQAQLTALAASHNELVKALADLKGLDADALVQRIGAAVRKALADATVDVDVNVHGDATV